MPERGNVLSETAIDCSLERRRILSELQQHIAHAAFFLCFLDTATALRPAPQPEQISAYTAPLTTGDEENLLSPTGNVDALIRNLRTTKDLEIFLEKNTTYKQSPFSPNFINTYRESPTQFQKNGWEGSCSHFAEFNATWAYVHGGKPYMVTLCPRGLIEKKSDLWHQVVVCKHHNGQFVVFRNQNVELISGPLTAYLSKEYPTMELMPFGSIIPWRARKDDWRAKAGEHIFLSSVNPETMETGNLPLSPELLQELARGTKPGEEELAVSG